MNKKTNLKRIAIASLAFFVLLLLAACSKKENTEQSSNAPAESAAPAQPATPIDPATAATVNGTVKFDGTAPKQSKIDMSQDPGCKGMRSEEHTSELQSRQYL